MWCQWPNTCTAPLLLLTHYTTHLPWTVTIHNIPILPYRLQCLNTPEYKGRKLLWKVVTLCQLTWLHIPEDFNLHWYHHENLKSCFVKNTYLCALSPDRSPTDVAWGTFTILPIINLPSRPLRYISTNQMDLSLAKVIIIHNLWTEWLHDGRGM